jgi:CP family cyanate transporter-like MFS transporter
MVLVAALVLVSVNLRGAIASVAPVLGDVTTDLGLSGTQAGLLTTLPVLCFAVTAPAAAWLARRAGVDRAILLALVVVTAATALRPYGGTWLMLGGSLVVGTALTVGNVLVPVVVKRDFPNRVGSLTGLYTASLTAGAAITAGLTAPLAGVTGWRTALAAWSVLALVAVIVWSAATRTMAHPPHDDLAYRSSDDARHRVWRHPVAWALATYLGAQAATYYALTAWLPTLLQDEAGLAAPIAGSAMAVFQVLGIVGTLLIPPLTARRSRQSGIGVLVAVGWGVSLAGLLVAPHLWAVWCLLAGVTQGAGISLAFVLVVLRSRDAAVARELSSMVQTVGYAAGALGPVMMGGLAGTRGGWDVALAAMVAVTVVMGTAVARAGRADLIG